MNQNLIPAADPLFEKFGLYNDVKKIIKSKKFFPTFITGHSGLGKTVCVLQACAELKRECIRLNFSTETDQSDIIGSDTLSNGNIVFREGPVILALRSGAILLMDDCDRANQQVLTSLFSVLEGNGIYIPKTGEWVRPKEGFNVILTANTKGYGDDTGKYLSQIMDSAFLERFHVTFEAEYPTEKTEKKILMNYFGSLMDTIKADEEIFVDNLVKWANVIRKTFENGGINDIISTRRLVSIVTTYSIFLDKLKSINMCCNRFDDHTKEAFVDLYTKIDAGVNVEPELFGDSNKELPEEVAY